jgi:hypothetical protein
MVMRIRRSGILLLLFCLRLPAPLIPGPNLAKRIESSQIIAVARVVGGTSFASGSEMSSDITLHIERVLKGDLTPGIEISAHLTGRGYFMAPEPKQLAITERLYGIWFLNTDTQSYKVVSRDGSYGELFAAPVILPEDASPENAGSTPGESVANELTAALRSVAQKQASLLNPGAEREGTAEQRKLAGLERSRFHSLAEDLRTLVPSTTRKLYRDFANDSSPALRALGIQGLIEANDPEGVKRADADWDELNTAADVQPIVAALMGYSNDADGSAVSALGSLALRKSGGAPLRENASYALRAIHSSQAVPALAGLLDADEERVRINALAGLCLFVRNAPTVTPQAVVSMAWMQSRQPAPLLNAETQSYCLMGGLPGSTGNLAPYVTFWRAWWNEHRGSIEKN